MHTTHNFCIIRIMAIATTIIGASGYAGQETLDRVLAHPELELVALGSDSLAGSPAGVLDPRLNGSLPAFTTNEQALAAGADLVFCCLEHERAAALEPPPDAVVVDLSGAHRLDDPSLYPAWYGFEHPAPASLPGWSYAIPELFPPEGPLIANPGCYATAVLLALAPLVGSIEPAGVVVDAKSGVSGAGRTLKASSHATSVLENLSPYKIGSHQHAPELEQALGFPVCFAPHLLPVRRGLLATCYVHTDADARALLEDAYADAPAIRVLDEGLAPDLSRVQHTDSAEIAVYEDRATGRTIVACAIDNLGKGAAGNAVQNANVALGFDATAGLRLHGVLV
jgi:N-acetyl-gamma-glutamyl-phosphate reductase